MRMSSEFFFPTLPVTRLRISSPTYGYYIKVALIGRRRRRRFERRGKRNYFLFCQTDDMSEIARERGGGGG